MARMARKVSVDIDLKVPDEVRKFIAENEEAVAMEIEATAKASTAFEDKTGKLRKSIKAKRSRFENGGWIVRATAPHAHLVEFGHQMVDHDGKTIGTVGPRSYLRTAKEKAIADAIRLFGVR